jgi:hypothetical protein
VLGIWGARRPSGGRERPACGGRCFGYATGPPRPPRPIVIRHHRCAPALPRWSGDVNRLREIGPPGALGRRFDASWLTIAPDQPWAALHRRLQPAKRRSRVAPLPNASAAPTFQRCVPRPSSPSRRRLSSWPPRAPACELVRVLPDPQPSLRTNLAHDASPLGPPPAPRAPSLLLEVH